MRVVILGCGYVGIELGKQLAAGGHEVVGVRRSPAGQSAIESAGFEAVRADVTEPRSFDTIPDAEMVVFAASSGGRDIDVARKVFVSGLQTAIEQFGSRKNPPDRFVYASSSGVYGDHSGKWVDESTPIEPTTEKTRILADAERIASDRSESYGVDWTVVRLTGLYGPSRYRLKRYLSKPVAEGYCNMIHRDDAAGVIRHLLGGDFARNEVVLAVDNEPVDRWELADWIADQCGVERPEKLTVADRLAQENLSERLKRRLNTDKRCSNAKLRSLGYAFTYPTYREGFRNAITSFRRERS